MSIADSKCETNSNTVLYKVKTHGGDSIEETVKPFRGSDR